ncbi:MAG TPA: DinB family protein [Candidatus Acidoferrales bacterium]
MANNTECKRIADQLRRSFHGEAWHGPAVLELLIDVDAQRAAARPIASAHTIWEIALHIGVWQEASRGYLAGESPALPDLYNKPEEWPAPTDTSDAAWSRTLETLREQNAALVALVKQLNDDRLKEIVPGREFSLYFLLHGVVQHNLYHAGQIALLKK